MGMGMGLHVPLLPSMELHVNTCLRDLTMSGSAAARPMPLMMDEDPLMMMVADRILAHMALALAEQMLSALSLKLHGLHVAQVQPALHDVVSGGGATPRRAAPRANIWQQGWRGGDVNMHAWSHCSPLAYPQSLPQGLPRPGLRQHSAHPHKPGLHACMARDVRTCHLHLLRPACAFTCHAGLAPVPSPAGG